MSTRVGYYKVTTKGDDIVLIVTDQDDAEVVTIQMPWRDARAIAYVLIGLTDDWRDRESKNHR